MENLSPGHSLPGAGHSDLGHRADRQPQSAIGCAGPDSSAAGAQCAGGASRAFGVAPGVDGGGAKAGSAPGLAGQSRESAQLTPDAVAETAAVAALAKLTEAGPYYSGGVVRELRAWCLAHMSEPAWAQAHTPG